MADTYLYPDSTVSGTWTFVGAASLPLAIDDPFGADDDDTTYAQGSGVSWVDQIVGFAPMPDAVEITAVELQARYNNAGGGANQEFDFGLVVNGTNFLNGTIPVNLATYTTVTKQWLVNPVTGGLFTKAQLDDIQAIIRTQDAGGKPIDSVRVTSLRLKVTYQPLPVDLATTRGLASARLRRYRQEIPQAIVSAPPSALDLELLDNVSLSDPSAPSGYSDGWGTLNWKRRLHGLRDITFNPNSLGVGLTLWDQRRFLCTAWDTAETTRGTGSDEQGVARLSAGGAFSTARGSHIWPEDCASRLVVQKAANERAFDFAGVLTDAAATRYGVALIESAATNYLVHSSAAAGATAVAALSVTGASGTFATEAATVSPLFDGAVSPNNYIFTAGSPHSADKRVAWPATASIAGGTIVRFSIDYANPNAVSNGDRLRWRLQRSIDSWYWNDSTGAWQSGAVDNVLTLSTTRTRGKSKAINVGASATTLTLTLATLTGGTNGRIDRVYHVQLEDKAWSTSRIVTGATTYARASQLDSWTNLSGARSINAAGGTFFCAFVPRFDAADVTAAGATLKLFDVTYDASNWFRLYYDGTNVTFSIRASGTTTTATQAWSAVAGTRAFIAARWTSAAGEYGLVRTHDVYVNGVKGTSATRAADPTESTSPLYVGCDSSGNQANGHLSRREFLQTPLTDEEIAAEAA